MKLKDSKKKIMKQAVESAKEEKAEEKSEKDGMGGPSFGNNPGISKVGENMTGKGGLASKYKNLKK